MKNSFSGLYFRSRNNRKLKAIIMKKSIIAILAVLFVVVFAGCDKAHDNGTGRLVVKITDAPFPIENVEYATVKITKVELRKEGDCNCDESPFVTVWEGSEIFNLLELRNGVVEELADLEIPQGVYDLVRIYVDEAALKVRDGDEYAVKVPSGKQTGIKVFIEPGINVAGGISAELLLDFDLSRSFVMRGNIQHPEKFNGFIFKPVVRAVNNSIAGRLEGIVKDTESVRIKSARVYVKQDTTIVSSVADTLGHYEVIGLPEGLYSVSAVQDGYDSVVVDDVSILSGNRTIRDFILPGEE
jgi:hypothetical protein